MFRFPGDKNFLFLNEYRLLMIRWSAILLLFIYMLGATNACQFLKLPLLVSHYIKHKKESPYITLASFFKMHYVDPQPFDADYAQDMQLPFKTTPNAFFRYTPSIPSQTPLLKPKFLWTEMVTSPPSNEDILSSLYIHPIFQPPRV